MTYQPAQHPNPFPRFEETLAEHCPACQSTNLQQGHLNLGEGGGEFILFGIKLKLFRATHGMPLQSPKFQMCGDCGLFFRKEDVRELNHFIERNAKKT